MKIIRGVYMVKKVLRQALMLVCSITMLAQPVTALTEDNVVRNEIFTIESTVTAKQ